MIRPAKFGDIPRLTEMAHELHARSRYAARASLVPERFKKICLESIRHHGSTASLFVADQAGSIEAFMIGATDWVYGIGDKRWAFDLFWYATPGADAASAEGVLEAFVAWARQAPDVIEVRPSANDIIDGMDYRVVERILRRHGFVQDGVTYRMEVSA